MRRTGGNKPRVGLEATTRPRLEEMDLTVRPPLGKQAVDVPPPSEPQRTQKSRNPKLPFIIPQREGEQDPIKTTLPPFISIYNLLKEGINDRETDENLKTLDVIALRINDLNTEQVGDIYKTVSERYGPETANLVLKKIKENLRSDSDQTATWFTQFVNGDMTADQFHERCRNAAIDSAARIVDDIPGVEKLKKKAKKMTVNSPEIMEVGFGLFFRKVIRDLEENDFLDLIPTKMVVLSEIYRFDFVNNPPEQLMTKFSAAIQEHIDNFDKKLNQALIRFPEALSTIEFLKFVMSRLLKKGQDPASEWDGGIRKYLDKSGILDAWKKELVDAKPELTQLVGAKTKTKIGNGLQGWIDAFLTKIVGFAAVLAFWVWFKEVSEKTFPLYQVNKSTYVANVSEVKNHLETLYTRGNGTDIPSQMRRAINEMDEERKGLLQDRVLQLFDPRSVQTLESSKWYYNEPQTLEEATDFSFFVQTLKNTVNDTLTTSNVTMKSKMFMPHTIDFMRAHKATTAGNFTESFAGHVATSLNETWLGNYRDFIGIPTGERFIDKFLFACVFEDLLGIVNDHKGWDVFNSKDLCVLTGRVARILYREDRFEQSTDMICEKIKESFESLYKLKWPSEQRKYNVVAPNATITRERSKFMIDLRTLQEELEKTTSVEELMAIQKKISEAYNLIPESDRLKEEAPIIEELSKVFEETVPSEGWFSVSAGKEWVIWYMRSTSPALIAYDLVFPSAPETPTSENQSVEPPNLDLERFNQLKRTLKEQAKKFSDPKAAISKDEMTTSLGVALEVIFKMMHEIRSESAPKFDYPEYETARRDFLKTFWKGFARNVDRSQIDVFVDDVLKSKYYPMTIPRLIKLVNRSSVLTEAIQKLQSAQDIHSKVLNPNAIYNLRIFLKNYDLMITYQEKVKGNPTWIRTIFGIDKLDVSAPKSYLEYLMSWIIPPVRQNEAETLKDFVFSENGGVREKSIDEKYQTWTEDWKTRVGREAVIYVSRGFWKILSQIGVTNKDDPNPIQTTTELIIALYGNEKMRFYLSFFFDILSSSICCGVVQDVIRLISETGKGLWGLVRPQDTNTSLLRRSLGLLANGVEYLAEASLYTIEFGLVYLNAMNMAVTLEGSILLGRYLGWDWLTSVAIQLGLITLSGSIPIKKGVTLRSLATSTLEKIIKKFDPNAFEPVGENPPTSSLYEWRMKFRQKSTIERMKEYQGLIRSVSIARTKVNNMLEQAEKDEINILANIEFILADQEATDLEKKLEEAKVIVETPYLERSFGRLINDVIEEVVALMTNLGSYAVKILPDTWVGIISLVNAILEAVTAQNVGAYQIFVFVLFVLADLTAAHYRRVMRPNDEWTTFDYFMNSIPNLTPFSSIITYSKRLEAATEEPVTSLSDATGKLLFVTTGIPYTPELHRQNAEFMSKRRWQLLFKILGSGVCLGLLDWANYSFTSDFIALKSHDRDMRVLLSDRKVHETLKLLFEWSE